MTDTPAILTNDDVAAYAATIGKAVSDLTSEDYAALAASHGGSIAMEPPPVTVSDLEAAHATYVVPGLVPLVTTMLRFKLALRALGFYAAVKAAAESDDLAEIYWTSPGSVERTHPQTIRLAIGLGWGPQRLDEVMTLAETM